MATESEAPAVKKPRIFAMPFVRVYPEYVNKAAKKGRSQDEVDQVITWLTGYDEAGLQAQLAAETTIEAFYAEAPAMNPARTQITGTVCGVRVEAIEDPTMQAIRQLDKLIDELAKGRPMEKILRTLEDGEATVERLRPGALAKRLAALDTTEG